MIFGIFGTEFSVFSVFLLRIILFRIQKIPIRFKAKLTFFSRYFASLIFAFVSLRFASKRNEGTP